MSKKDIHMPILRVQNLKKAFPQGDQGSLEVLKSIDFQLYPGEIVALVGTSGSGKSTLLHILGLLEQASSGQIHFENRDVSMLSEKERTELRLSHVGFVYQFHHLLPEFTALENVVLPQLLAGVPRSQAERQALKLLKSMGLEERQDHRPSKLSGGEQQRVAILRAVANAPKLILADEPTGNLDEMTSEKVFQELLSMVRGTQMSALIATHDLSLAKKMDRILHLQKGMIHHP